MTEDKPLYVRTAEALGCRPVFETYEDNHVEKGPVWRCLCPRPEEVPDGPWDRAIYDHERLPARPRHIALRCGASLEVARYDESWFSTGPWVERLGIALRRYPTNAGEVSNPDELRYAWEARDAQGEFCSEGTTALVAACGLIVDLARQRPGMFT